MKKYHPNLKHTINAEGFLTKSVARSNESGNKEKLAGFTKEHFVLPETTVKTKPQYDPDSEVTGLMLTVPSWIGSMERVRTKVNLSDVADITKDKLCRTLHLLMVEAAKTMKEVMRV